MKLSIFLLSFFFSIAANCQLSQPLSGSPFSTERKENFSGFIGQTESAVYSVDYLYISRKKQELNVRKFHRADLALMESRNIYVAPEGDYYSEPTEVFFQNGKIYLFSVWFGEKGNSNLIKLEIFDENMERVSSGTVDTFDLDEVSIISESKDDDEFIICRYNRYSKLTEQQVILSSIDQNGVVRWKKKVKSPMALQNLSVERVVFSRKTPVFILCNYAFELQNTNAVSDQDLINNKYSLWSYDPRKNFLKEFELRIKGKWINGIKIGLSERNELIVSGYMNETRNHAINGVFSVVLDKNLNVRSSAINKFNATVRKKFVEAQDLNKTTELDDYMLNEMIIQNNGSYFLTGERFYKYIERSYDPRTNITTTTEHFNYNSIIVSYFDSLGNHIWTERVPKFQNSTNDFGYFASYSVMNTDNGAYLFFNDTDKNNELTLTDYFNYKSLFNNRNSQITYVYVSQDGVQSRGVLIPADNEFVLRAKQCRQISDEMMYLMGESGRQSRVFAVGLKE
jgi:hypothetical protein